MDTPPEWAAGHELPSYFDGPATIQHLGWAPTWARIRSGRGSQRPSPGGPSFGRKSSSGRPDRVASSAFACMARLPGVAGAFEVLWPDPVGDEVLVVNRRLKLDHPRGDPSSGWVIECRMRRLLGIRWVPMVLEVWPAYGDYVRLTMNPKARVVAKWKYFGSGNRLLEKLCSELAAASTRTR